MLRIDLKSAFFLTVIIALLLCLLSKSCKLNKAEKKLAKCEQADKPKPIHDTVTIIIPTQTPIKETITQTASVKPTPREIDSFITYEVIVDTTDLHKLKTAYFDLLQEYNTRNEYVDTSIFKYGTAITNSVVKRNQLIDQHTTLDSIRQEIIHDIVYKNTYKDRTQLYLGLEALGSKYELINAAGVTALLKLKGNIGIEGGYFFNSQNQNFYKAGFKFLIRLKKP